MWKKMKTYRRHRKGTLLETTRVDAVRIVDANTLLIMTKNDRDSIESIKFEPPVIGGKGFGDFAIKFKHPRYEVIKG
ncbi:hypothetical protein ACN6UB_19470 [Serratia marcescens]|uniref:hypothetical protein n=1 Tax=Serratia marcescens TaxID=615 RepID=UPI003AFA66A3